MNDGRPDNPSDRADGHATPRELRGVARLLDERGARERGRLGDASVHRIFAASDLQRPLDLGAVSPVVGRIGAARTSSRPLFRLAAAIAVVAGLGAIAALVLSQRGGGAHDSSKMAVGAPDAPAPSAPNAPASEAVPSERALAAAHLESALDDSFGVSTATRPASAVIMALADRGGGSLAGFASFEGAVSDELEPLLSTGALLGGDDITYDGLSQELASVVMRAPSPR
jgi:hypothetical protein